jgi:chromate transporter
MSLTELVGYVALYNLITLSNGPVMVAMLEQSLVTHRHLLTLDQLLFAFTLGRVTPGPASSYVASIGFMSFGLVGALATTIAIVAPGYVVLPMLAGYQRIRKNTWVQRFVHGLIAAQVGLIGVAVVRLGVETLSTWRAWPIFAVTFALCHWKRASALASRVDFSETKRV